MVLLLFYMLYDHLLHTSVPSASNLRILFRLFYITHSQIQLNWHYITAMKSLTDFPRSTKVDDTQQCICNYNRIWLAVAKCCCVQRICNCDRVYIIHAVTVLMKPADPNLLVTCSVYCYFNIICPSPTRQQNRYIVPPPPLL